MTVTTLNSYTTTSIKLNSNGYGPVLTVTNTGTVSVPPNGSGAGVSAVIAYGAGTSLANFGTLRASTATNTKGARGGEGVIAKYGSYIYNDSGGMIIGGAAGTYGVNQGVGRANLGGGYGVDLVQASIVNAGSITGGAASGGNIGAGGIAAFYSSVVNDATGHISGGSGGASADLAFHPNGVYLGDSTLVNMGVVTGGTTPGTSTSNYVVRAGVGVGIDAFARNATQSYINNSGTIAGGTGGVYQNTTTNVEIGEAGGTGVKLAVGSLLNTGLIEGGNAATGGTGVVYGRYGGSGLVIGSGGYHAIAANAASGRIIGGNGANGNANAPTGGYGNVSLYRGGYGAFLNNGSFTNDGLVEGGNGASAGPNAAAGRGGVGLYDLAGGTSSNYTNLLNGTGSVEGGTGGAGSTAHSTAGAGGTGVVLSVNSAVTLALTITGGKGGTGIPASYGGTGGTGLLMDPTNEVTNDGSITGGAGGGGGHTGAGGYGVQIGGSGTLMNNGTITGGAGSVAGNGVLVDDDASLTNNGSIANGAGSAGGIGVRLLVGSTLTNAHGAGITGRTGVYDYGGTIVNAGTIQGAGGLAVELEAGDGGRLVVDSGAVFGGVVQGDDASSVLELAAGTGTINGLGTNFTQFGTLLLDAGAGWTMTGGNALTNTSFTNYGTAILDGSLNSSGTLLNDGTIVIAQANAAIVTGITGTGTLTLGASSMLEVADTISNHQTITFGGGDAILTSNNAANLSARISGFAATDTISLLGLTATSFDYVTGTGLEVTGDGQTVLLDITGNNLQTSSFQVDTNTVGTEITMCFYPGTRVATPAGEMAVELLQPGDMVRTAQGDMPVRWIGQNHIDLRFANCQRTLPVRIKAGALGSGLPIRDLLLSPDHAVFMKGLLVQAGALIGQPGITQESDVPEQFTYYHVELDTHELLYAEGALAESFVDNVSRMHFHNWDERKAPSQPIQEMDLPRVKSARQLPREILQGRLASLRAC